MLWAGDVVVVLQGVLLPISPQQTMHAVVLLSDVGRVCCLFHHSEATFIVLL